MRTSTDAMTGGRLPFRYQLRLRRRRRGASNQSDRSGERGAAGRRAPLFTRRPATRPLAVRHRRRRPCGGGPPWPRPLTRHSTTLNTAPPSTASPATAKALCGTTVRCTTYRARARPSTSRSILFPFPPTAPPRKNQRSSPPHRPAICSRRVLFHETSGNVLLTKTP